MKRSGIDYFPFPANLPINFKMLEIKHGLEVYVVYLKILQDIFSNEGYYLSYSEDYLELFADSLKLQKEKVQAIILDFVNKEIFSKIMFEKFSILTSNEIQRDYINAVKRRKVISMDFNYCLEYALEFYKEVLKDKECSYFSIVNDEKVEENLFNKQLKENLNLNGIEILCIDDDEIDNFNQKSGQSGQSDWWEKQDKMAKMHTECNKVKESKEKESKVNQSKGKKMKEDESKNSTRGNGGAIFVEDQNYVESSSSSNKENMLGSNISDVVDTNMSGMVDDNIQDMVCTKSALSDDVELFPNEKSAIASLGGGNSDIVNKDILDIRKFAVATGKYVGDVKCLPDGVDIDKLIQRVQESTFLTQSPYFTLAKCLQKYDKIISGAYANFAEIREEKQSEKEREKSIFREREYTQEELQSFYTNLDDLDFDED